MICGKCQKEIDKSESYAKIEIYEIGKLKHVGFMHKTCNDKIDEERKQTQELIGKVMNMAKRVEGILPPTQMGFEVR